MLASILHGGISYEKMFISEGWEVEHVTAYNQISSLSDLIVFTGGPDINPKCYNQDPHPSTVIMQSGRTSVEHHVFTQGVQNNIGMVGICRGAQHFCIEMGGKLIQHVSNHRIFGTHKIITGDGTEFDVTSTHHQMMQPKGDNSQILAWAEGLSDTYEGSKGVKVEIDVPGCEPEVVLWKKMNIVGFQYHPEYMRPDSEGVKYFFNLIEEVI